MTNSYHGNLNTHLWEELASIHREIYGDNPYMNQEEAYGSLQALMTKYHEKRPERYLKKDQQGGGWFKSQKMVGVTLYVDLFSENLEGFQDKVNYLIDLGITMIHFMPILKGRPGENDGGYAVMDYKSIDDRFGNFKTFEKVLKLLEKKGIHVAVDFVINHTAKEHEWARKALAGDQDYMNYYHMFEDNHIPNLYEETVPEVFPGVAPGNFTYYEAIDRYVMTSFYEFQWDLNYNNPKVFEAVVDILLYLANKGVDMIRLDAIPFIWKELGTTCRNLPKVHKILRMFHIITELTCPSVALLGEAIVAAEEIVGYYGREQMECDVMYNAPMMVNLWNALATRDTRLLTIDSNRLQIPVEGAWINYIRCHDDIGWGFNEEAIRSFGSDPFMHKQFLISFFLGSFEGSFSEGELYEFDPKTMDARNCGTLASLCGVEKALALSDQYQLELANKRIDLIFGYLMASTGIPLIYSGDDIAMLNNHDYKKDPAKAHDSRWLHRAPFDWSILEDPTSNGYVMNRRLKDLIKKRKEEQLLSVDVAMHSMDTGNHHVYAFNKSDGDHQLVGLFNFSEDRQFIDSWNIRPFLHTSNMKDLLTGKCVDFNREHIQLGPYEYVWLKG